MAINQDITFPFINSLKNYVKLVTKKEKEKFDTTDRRCII